MAQTITIEMPSSPPEVTIDLAPGSVTIDCADSTVEIDITGAVVQGDMFQAIYDADGDGRIDNDAIDADFGSFVR